MKPLSDEGQRADSDRDEILAEIDRLRAENDRYIFDIMSLEESLELETERLASVVEELEDNYENLEAWCRPLEGLLDAVRAERDHLRLVADCWEAAATELRSALVRWGHIASFPPYDPWDRDLLALIPDDDWGIVS